MRNYSNTNTSPVRFHCRVRRCRNGNYQTLVYADSGSGWRVNALHDAKTYAECDAFVRRVEEPGYHPEFIDEGDTLPFPVVEFNPDIPEPVPMSEDPFMSRTPVPQVCTEPTWGAWKRPVPDPEKSAFFTDADPEQWWGQ